MGIVLAVLLIELVLCVAAFVWAKRRGLATTVAHLLALDFGWLVGLWARQSRLQAIIAEALTQGSAEDAFPKCIDMLRGLGPQYSNATCVFLGTRSGQLALGYSDPGGWLLGGLSGIALISLPAILLFWISLLLITARSYLLPISSTWADRWNAIWCMMGFVIGRNRPYYIATDPLIPDGRLAQTLGGKIVARYVGPGAILANSHYAVPLTGGPRLTRVGTARLIFTRPKEQPLQVVDLRPHIRLCSVKATTRDGIEIKTLLFLVFRIDPHGMDAPENNPEDQLYPFSDKAVFAAIRAQKSKPDETQLWDDFLFDIAHSAAYDVFGQYQFDELQGTQNREAVRSAIMEKVCEEIGTSSQPKWRGIHLMGIGLSNIEPARSDVTFWQIKKWQATMAGAKAQSNVLNLLVARWEEARIMEVDEVSTAIIPRTIETIEPMIAHLPPSEQEPAARVLAAVKRRVSQS